MTKPTLRAGRTIRAMRTMRFRATAAATLLAALLLAVMSFVVVGLLRTQLSENLDDALRHRADILATLLSTDTQTLSIDEDTVARVTTPDRTVTSLGDIAATLEWPTPGGGGESLTTVRASSDQHVRLRALTRSVTSDRGATTVQLATRLDDVTGPTRIVGRALAFAVPTAIALLAALVWWLVGRALHPVEAIRAELADITMSDLSRRVPEPGTGDDIDRLARTTNATLARLETAVGRQQQLVADASHELRTPLARIRAALEVDLADARSTAADLVTTHRSVLDDTVALQLLLDDLLHLARSDAAGHGPMPSELVDLDDVVLAEASALRGRGRVPVDVTRVSAVQTRGSRTDLTRVVRNLLDNAGRHATSAVALTLTALDDRVRLTVTDDGPGVATDQRERVFERFTRLDDARSPDGGHTGLGLAIARDIVNRHGGTITIEGTAETCFVVTLPAIRAVPASDIGPAPPGP